MNVAIIGCGLIGQKRLQALGSEHRLVAAADTVLERARALAQRHPEALVTREWEQVICRSDVEAVIVSTTNNWLAPITLEAVRAGKHVLVEKPAARTPEELDPVIAIAESKGLCVQVGFNHRYHPGIVKARELVDGGHLGPLLFVRARYGHGGRLGYEREWRADRKVSGGGELLDQGIHLIDLARWFLGDFEHVTGSVHTYFWNMEVEDNAFLLLRTAQNQVAQLHVSWTEWKNLFSFEICTKLAKLEICGLGGSYGTERLTFYQMLPRLGPPETTIWEYPGEDFSWQCEFQAFSEAACLRKKPATGLRDARAALEVVHHLYRGKDS